MSHQRSYVHHFFPLNVQVIEKNYLKKICSISENKHKTTLENVNCAQIKKIYESSKVSFFLSTQRTSHKEKNSKVKLAQLVKINTKIYKNIILAKIIDI